MIYEILDRELSFPGLDAPRIEDVMTQAGGSLTKAGCAKDIYVEAIIAREKEYPAAKFFPTFRDAQNIWPAISSKH